MDTNVFRYVLEVDKCKNITLAAKHLFISQPALTKQLSKLEKELGFQLFDRAHTPITTTPQGELFLDFARRYQELEQDFQNDIALSRHTPAVPVRIATTHRGGGYAGIHTAAFMAAYPNICLEYLDTSARKCEELLEEEQVEQMNFCLHLMLGKASPKMLEVYRFLAENAERIGHLKHTPFYDGDKCTTWHISQGLGLYKVKPKEMEKIPALILTASLIRNPDTRLQALADELYERYGGSWLIPVFMKAIITQPKEQVYETYSLLLGTPKEIYLFNALGMLDYRCYPEDWIYERLGPDGMTAFIFWGHERYGSYDTTFMFERYVELDERWLFDLAKDPEGRKPTVTWQSYNRSGVLYESYDEMFISLLPRKVENPELKCVLRDYFRIRSQKKKVAKSITVYQDAAERFGD